LQAADKGPDAGGHHLLVQHVDIAAQRIIFRAGGVIVGEVDGDQILRHLVSPVVVTAGRLAAFILQTNARHGIRQVVSEILVLAGGSAIGILLPDSGRRGRPLP